MKLPGNKLLLGAVVLACSMTSLFALSSSADDLEDLELKTHSTLGNLEIETPTLTPKIPIEPRGSEVEEPLKREPEKYIQASYEILELNELLSDMEKYEGVRVAVEGWVRGFEIPKPNSGLGTGVLILGEGDGSLELLVPRGMNVFIQLGERALVFGVFHALGEEEKSTKHYGPNIEYEGLMKLWDY